jgi:hypothetical protein
MKTPWSFVDPQGFPVFSGWWFDCDWAAMHLTPEGFALARVSRLFGCRLNLQITH